MTGTLAAWASLALVPPILAVSALGPGLLVVRRTGWLPEEKLTAAIAFSLIAVGQATLLVFVLGLHPLVHGVVLLGCLAAAVAGRGEIAGFARSREARGALLATAAVALWLVALLAVIRNHSGGHWYGDWLEHFQRSRLFLGLQPLHTLFLQESPLPARPPLMNLIAAHLMALTQARYPHYQLITALLGGLSIVPAFQLARLFAPRSRCLWQALAAALMLLPMFAQNATFAWTKLTADFFVLAGVAFYVSGWQRGDPERLLTSFVCLAGGILTHYSAAPYALFLGLHAFVVVIPKRPARLRTVAALLLGLGLVLGPWLFWSTRVFGARSTFTSNSTWRDMSARTTLENVGKTVLNLRDTLIPQLLRGRPDEPIQAALSWGALRDAAFEAYQNNLPLSLGSLGAGLLVCDLLRRRRAAGVEPPGAAPSTRGRAPAAPGAFWLGFIVFSMVVGVASFGDRYGTGLAHITLQPVTLIGVVFLASQFAARPRALRWLAFTGLAVDAFLGVLLHVFLESIPLDTGEGAIRIPGLVMSDLVAGSGATNWSLKTEHQLQFFGDAIAPWAGLAWVAVAGLLTGAFLMLGRLAARGEPAESG